MPPEVRVNLPFYKYLCTLANLFSISSDVDLFRDSEKTKCWGTYRIPTDKQEVESFRYKCFKEYPAASHLQQAKEF